VSRLTVGLLQREIHSSVLQDSTVGEELAEKVPDVWGKTDQQLYKHEGVLHCCERAKKVVTYIHTSSQVVIPSHSVVGAICSMRSSGSAVYCMEWTIWILQ
jgi:hypothetical protein